MRIGSFIWRLLVGQWFEEHLAKMDRAETFLAWVEQTGIPSRWKGDYFDMVRSELIRLWDTVGTRQQDLTKARDTIARLYLGIPTTARGCKAPTYQSTIPSRLERDHTPDPGKMVPTLTHPVATAEQMAVECKITTTASETDPIMFVPAATATETKPRRQRKAVNGTPRQSKVKAAASEDPAVGSHWKVCTRCGGPAKPITDFYQGSNGKGYRPECKECTKRQVKEATARKQREQPQTVKRDPAIEPETMETISVPAAPTGTDKNRDAALARTEEMQRQISTLKPGCAITIQTKKGQIIGTVTACGVRVFSVSGCDSKGESVYSSISLSELVMGEVTIVEVKAPEEASVG